VANSASDKNTQELGAAIGSVYGADACCTRSGSPDARLEEQYCLRASTC
jgi:hypothetical protein